VKITYPSPPLDIIEEVSEPRKNMRGIGRIRYIRTAQIAKDYLTVTLKTIIRK
jgi:hypothetical protein